MKINSLGRKFIAYLIGILILTGIFCVIIFKAPEQISVSWPWFIAGEIFLTAVFVGGNVWKSYIQSKYFRPELAETKDEGK